MIIKLTWPELVKIIQETQVGPRPLGNYAEPDYYSRWLAEILTRL